MVNDDGENGEIWTRERCYIREIVNDPEIQQFSLAEARVEPGTTTELHRLDVDEWYVLVRGEGSVTVAQVHVGELRATARAQVSDPCRGNATSRTR